jgi:hypothetical protein
MAFFIVTAVKTLKSYIFACTLLDGKSAKEAENCLPAVTVLIQVLHTIDQGEGL